MVSNGYEMCDDFAQTTTATLGDVMGFDYCWLDVRTRVGGYDRTSSIWYRVRTNETPRVSTSLTCSDIVFLNDGYVDDGEIVNGGFRAERVYPVRFKLNIPEATNAVVTLSVNGNVQPRLYADAACETPLADTTFEMAAAEGENVATWYLIARKIGSGAVRATATLPSGEALTNAVNFRVIEPIRKLVTTSRDPEGFPVNPSRLVYEHGAWLEVGVNGQFTADEVAWSVVSGPGRIASVSNWQAKVEATADAGEVVVEASFGGDNTVQPRFVLPVIEEKRISIQGL